MSGAKLVSRRAFQRRAPVKRRRRRDSGDLDRTGRRGRRVAPREKWNRFAPGIPGEPRRVDRRAVASQNESLRARDAIVGREDAGETGGVAGSDPGVVVDRENEPAARPRDPFVDRARKPEVRRKRDQTEGGKTPSNLFPLGFPRPVVDDDGLESRRVLVRERFEAAEKGASAVAVDDDRRD